MNERDELRAALETRRELGPEYEPEIIDAFLTKVEKRLEERSPRHAARQGHRTVTPLVLGSLGLAIPLLVIAGERAGVVGVALVCLAIVLVNAFALRR